MLRQANLRGGEGVGDGCCAAEAAVGASRLSDSVSGFHYSCYDAGQDDACITGCWVWGLRDSAVTPPEASSPVSGSAVPVCLGCARQMCTQASWNGIVGKK